MTDEGRHGTIREEDIVVSIADALQYTAVYHPPSFVRALAEAYGREESPAAKDAIGQILKDSRLSAFGRRPICQDTGTVNAFVKVGIGVGGSVEKSMVMAKEVLLETIDMPELIRRGPSNAVEDLRLEIYDRVNAWGIGAQGLGGLTTVVDVKVRTFPCHAASKPVGLIPQCAADRYITFTLDGSGPAMLTPPRSVALAGHRRGSAGRTGAPRRSRSPDARGGRDMAGRRDDPAVGADADGPRGRP